MKLVDTVTLQFEEFEGECIPEYAILSHRWDEEEVLYKDLLKRRSLDKKGYAKIRHAANIAHQLGLNYIWIDTCCIDKSSSAELSEAINSMYQWYQSASVCLAYLYDVPEVEFEKSIWFNRGWTLQELIAPPNVYFYDRNWTYIGTKQDHADIIERTTRIQGDILAGSTRVQTIPIAIRMSWAADRTTTKPEDKAYCLLGIFSINMPMLYGEGTRAFQRLQQEIIRQSDDTSILFWNDPFHINGTTKLLAMHPSSFGHVQENTMIMNQLAKQQERVPFTLNNSGLSIELNLLPWLNTLYLALLPTRDYVYGALFLALRWDWRKKCFIRYKLNGSSLVYLRGKRVEERDARFLFASRDEEFIFSIRLNRFNQQSWEGHRLVCRQILISLDASRFNMTDSNVMKEEEPSTLLHGSPTDLHCLTITFKRGDFEIPSEEDKTMTVSQTQDHISVTFHSDPGANHLFGLLESSVIMNRQDGLNYYLCFAFDDNFDIVMVLDSSTHLKTRNLPKAFNKSRIRIDEAKDWSKNTEIHRFGTNDFIHLTTLGYSAKLASKYPSPPHIELSLSDFQKSISSTLTVEKSLKVSLSQRLRSRSKTPEPRD